MESSSFAALGVRSLTTIIPLFSSTKTFPPTNEAIFFTALTSSLDMYTLVIPAELLSTITTLVPVKVSLYAFSTALSNCSNEIFESFKLTLGKALTANTTFLPKPL